MHLGYYTLWIYTDHKLSRPPSSTVLDSHSTVSAVSAVAPGENPSFRYGYNSQNKVLIELEHSAQIGTDQKHRVPPGACLCSGPHSNVHFEANTSGGNCTTHRARLIYLGIATRVRRESLSNLSTQFRSTQTINTGSLPMPATVADHTRTHDSRQTRAVVTAQHTEYGKTRNLQRSPCLSRVKIYIPGGLAISSRGQTSFSATAVIIGGTALDYSYKWPKWGHFIDADIQPRYIFLVCT